MFSAKGDLGKGLSFSAIFLFLFRAMGGAEGWRLAKVSLVNLSGIMSSSVTREITLMILIPRIVSSIVPFSCVSYNWLELDMVAHCCCRGRKSCFAEG